MSGSQAVVQTAVQGAFQARRTDRLGVHSLDHFSLSAPLDEAAAFYTAFGLDVDRSEAGLAVRAFEDSHVWARVIPGDRKRLGYISFGAFEDDLPRFAARLDALGVVRESHGEAGDALWFRDPHGVLIEIRAAAKVMPDEKPGHQWRSNPAGVRSAPMRGQAGTVRPRRLSHALFFTPDIKTSIAFYAEVLGLRLSDFPGPVAFLHGAHGSDHHLIAFAESSTGVGYHHSAWAVASVDEIGVGAAQMAAAGFDRGWGLGRHVLGSNYFYYVRDPWGSYAEYSFDIDFVPPEQEWSASYPPPENSLYLWGPDVPADFVTNFEGAGRAAAEGR